MITRYIKFGFDYLKPNHISEIKKWMSDHNVVCHSKDFTLHKGIGEFAQAVFPNNETLVMFKLMFPDAVLDGEPKIVYMGG